MDNDSTSKEAYLFAYHKCVKAGKLTGKTMIKLLKWAVVKGWNKISASNTNRHGKQRIKQLIRKDQGVTSVDVSKTELRDFQKVARKYGVDFAVVKHLNEKPPVYSVFFKAKDQDAITDVIRAYTQKKLMKEQRPSLLERLHKLKEKVASTPKKVIHRAKEKVR